MNIQDYYRESLLRQTNKRTTVAELKDASQKAEWDALCKSFAKATALPVEQYMPSFLQTSEQLRDAECRRVARELQDNPFTILITKGLEYLSSCDECTEGLQLFKALSAHHDDLKSAVKGSIENSTSETKGLAELCGFSDKELLAVEGHALEIKDPALRSALFALLILFSPHRGDLWFYFAFSLYEQADADLQEFTYNASCIAMTLLPEEPEVYLFHAAILTEERKEEARSLIAHAEELEREHPISSEWEEIRAALRNAL